jgi:hypothetical protein
MAIKKGGGYVVASPKKTRQGQGKHSKINHGRKQSRGQGK